MRIVFLILSMFFFLSKQKRLQNTYQSVNQLKAGLNLNKEKIKTMYVTEEIV